MYGFNILNPEVLKDIYFGPDFGKSTERKTGGEPTKNPGQTMPTKYPKGAMIVNEGVRRMVLEELGDLRFTSLKQGTAVNWEATVSPEPYHILELERGGWKVEEEWPKMRDKYWFITETDHVHSIWLNDAVDNARRKQFGVYRTPEEAAVALSKCRKALGME